MLHAASMIAAARACIGTPFHHQGRAPGAGLDCIGLVIIALHAAGITVRDRTDYSRRPDGDSLVRALQEHGATAVSEIQVGDILLFRYDRQPQHAALATGADSMIHSFAPAGAVVETTIGDYWQRRLVGIYRFM
ncbi:MAG: NlpC/P60 family protein [Alphaproteobacteria bacterium]|nr:NlpC/P60 family protein [Alphaproteobacteria bacterium]